MTDLLVAVDWFSLLQVAIVTIIATCIIAALMSLANWFFTPHGEDKTIPRGRLIAGWVTLGFMCVLVAFGIWLIVPYFH